MCLGMLKFGLHIKTCELKPECLEDDREFPYVPGGLVHLDVDPTVAPTKNAYCSVPAAFQKPARERLSKMDKQSICSRVWLV